MRGRKARMGTPLHCRMAEAAIDPKAVDMMFMAERDRLGNRPSNLALIARPARYRPKQGQKKNAAGQEQHCKPCICHNSRLEDRKSVVEGKSVSVGVDLVGRRVIKKKKK